MTKEKEDFDTIDIVEKEKAFRGKWSQFMKERIASSTLNSKTHEDVFISFHSKEHPTIQLKASLLAYHNSREMKDVSEITFMEPELDRLLKSNPKKETTDTLHFLIESLGSISSIYTDTKENSNVVYLEVIFLNTQTNDNTLNDEKSKLVSLYHDQPTLFLKINNESINQIGGSPSSFHSQTLSAVQVVVFMQKAHPNQWSWISTLLDNAETSTRFIQYWRVLTPPERLRLLTTARTRAERKLRKKVEDARTILCDVSDRLERILIQAKDNESNREDLVTLLNAAGLLGSSPPPLTSHQDSQSQDKEKSIILLTSAISSLTIHPQGLPTIVKEITNLILMPKSSNHIEKDLEYSFSIPTNLTVQVQKTKDQSQNEGIHWKLISKPNEKKEVNQEKEKEEEEEEDTGLYLNTILFCTENLRTTANKYCSILFGEKKNQPKEGKEDVKDDIYSLLAYHLLKGPSLVTSTLLIFELFKSLFEHWIDQLEALTAEESKMINTNSAASTSSSNRYKFCGLCAKPLGPNDPADRLSCQSCRQNSKTPTPPQILKKCVVCSKTEKLSRCGKCKLIYYCGIECQKSDWKRHKKFCL